MCWSNSPCKVGLIGNLQCMQCSHLKFFFLYLTLCYTALGAVLKLNVPPSRLSVPPSRFEIWFIGGKSFCFWPEKPFKFLISARKSLRISAKTFFFWRSPVFGRKNRLIFFFLGSSSFKKHTPKKSWLRACSSLRFSQR